MSTVSRTSPGWWKWVVMLSSLWALLVGGSLSYCSGVFHVALLEHFKQDVVETAWLGSLFSSMFALTGPISSLAINLVSCRFCVMLGSLLVLVGFTVSSFITDMRWLFLTYAVLIGLGEGMVYLGSIVAFSVYFPGQVSMASGVGLAGLSLGIFVFPPLAQLLLDHYGLQGCFLLIGATAFQSAVFGALMRPCSVQIQDVTINDSEESVCKKVSKTVSKEKGSLRDLIKPSYLLFLFSAFCFQAGLYVNYLYLPDFLIKEGSTPQEASLLLSLAGAGGVVSRILAGFAANDSKIGPLVMYAGSYGVAATLQFIIHPLCSTSTGKIGYALMYGIYCSTGCVLLSPVTMITVGAKNFSSGMGLILMSCGLGSLTIPPLAGLIGELTYGYDTIFIVAGVCFSCTSICAFILMGLVRSQVDQISMKDTANPGEETSMIPQNVCDTADLPATDKARLPINDENEL